MNGQKRMHVKAEIKQFGQNIKLCIGHVRLVTYQSQVWKLLGVVAELFVIRR